MAQLPNVFIYSTVIDLVTGVHTQNVESYWTHVKQRFETITGVSSEQLPSHLVHVGREMGQKKETLFTNLMSDISSQYPV